MLFWWLYLTSKIPDPTGLVSTPNFLGQILNDQVLSLLDSWLVDRSRDGGGLGGNNNLFYIIFLWSLWSHAVRVTFCHWNLGAPLYFQSLESSIYVQNNWVSCSIVWWEDKTPKVLRLHRILYRLNSELVPESWEAMCFFHDTFYNCVHWPKYWATQFSLTTAKWLSLQI